MAKVKYRVREYSPTENQNGSHSWFAEAVINSKLSNNDLAKKIAARTGVKSYEVTTVLGAIADIVAEEVLESNTITLANEEGQQMLTIYPKVTGSITDAYVQAHPEKFENATAATEDMLTADMLTWTLGAQMGIKFSKQFAMNKQAQKVKYVASDVAVPNEEEEPTSGNQGGTTPTTNGENSEP